MTPAENEPTRVAPNRRPVSVFFWGAIDHGPAVAVANQVASWSSVKRSIS
jgi:hypothetical protein